MCRAYKLYSGFQILSLANNTIDFAEGLLMFGYEKTHGFSQL